MTITLIRHGPVDISRNHLIDVHEFSQWITAYDEARIIPLTQAHSDMSPLTSTLDAPYILTSNLKRSIDSASCIFGSQHTADICYREAQLPLLNIPFLKCHATQWSCLCRLLWMLGYSPHVESRALFKNRIEEGTEQLIQLSSLYDNVVLVGHYWVNKLIQKNLKKYGWGKKIDASSSKHWGYAIFEKL